MYIVHSMLIFDNRSMIYSINYYNNMLYCYLLLILRLFTCVKSTPILLRVNN